jgi:hypothetical protein
LDKSEDQIDHTLASSLRIGLKAVLSLAQRKPRPQLVAVSAEPAPPHEARDPVLSLTTMELGRPPALEIRESIESLNYTSHLVPPRMITLKSELRGRVAISNQRRRDVSRSERKEEGLTQQKRDTTVTLPAAQGGFVLDSDSEGPGLSVEEAQNLAAEGSFEQDDALKTFSRDRNLEEN